MLSPPDRHEPPPPDHVDRRPLRYVYHHLAPLATRPGALAIARCITCGDPKTRKRVLKVRAPSPPRSATLVLPARGPAEWFAFFDDNGSGRINCLYSCAYLRLS